MLIETRQNIDEHEVWGAVWGSDGNGFSYWVGKARALDGGDLHYYLNTSAESFSDWVLNPQDFRLWNDEGSEYVVTLYGLCKAYADLRAEGWTHCGGSLLDDNDACTEDAILQYAVFGEMVYG
jgi:hypothetical protein